MLFLISYKSIFLRKKNSTLYCFLYINIYYTQINILNQTKINIILNQYNNAKFLYFQDN